MTLVIKLLQIIEGSELTEVAIFFFQQTQLDYGQLTIGSTCTRAHEKCLNGNCRAAATALLSMAVCLTKI